MIAFMVIGVTIRVIRVIIFMNFRFNTKDEQEYMPEPQNEQARIGNLQPY